ncbi:MAG TPA: hypothetical protein DCZ91_15065 [Lachnospiraceae bacterium]|nr:hypothetical protein [Lachnospiraceae bacterium]
MYFLNDSGTIWPVWLEHIVLNREVDFLAVIWYTDIQSSTIPERYQGRFQDFYRIRRAVYGQFMGIF